jgi:NitT/TauT family transport system substrate-binding protein
MKSDEYAVFLPGTRFFNAADNAAALGVDPAGAAKSLVAVGPSIHAFLTANKLVEGPVDFAGGIDKTLLIDAQKK